MTRFRVIVEVSAGQDIHEAYLWPAERSPEAAVQWLDGLYDTMASLELFPERCLIAPESEFFNVRIREIFHGRRKYKYRILFTVSKGEVHILHVRHGARRALGEPETSQE
jgi:plasmid stabilization system protein ParE